MRCVRFLFLLLAVTSPLLHAAEPADGVPPLLFEAMTRIAENFDRWAYTETLHMTNEHGTPQPETIVRFDPSRPYEEQYQPILVKGKAPTEHDLKMYRRRGLNRGEKLAKDEAAGKAPGTQPPTFKLNGGSASIDLAHASVVGETAESVTYEVPLKNDGRETIPVEKFQLIARVNKQRQAFENVALKVRSSFRMKLLVKVKSGDASVDFAVVDPHHAPALTHITGDATASVMFMTFGGSFDLTRADFKRVKPYSERFGVKIGPMKALNF